MRNNSADPAVTYHNQHLFFFYMKDHSRSRYQDFLLVYNQNYSKDCDMGLELIISEMKAFIKHIHRLKPEKNLKINATVMKVQEKGKKKTSLRIIHSLH